MNPALVERIGKMMAAGRRILLTTHQNPDGDGMGSEIALAAHLRSIGREPRILNPDPMPERYRFLDPTGEVMGFDPASGPGLVAECDLIVTLDNSSPARLGGLEGPIRSSPATRICIDHHTSTDDFWNLNLIDESACATGEMVYRLIRAWGGQPDFTSAVALYTALVTDTGNFRFSKTGPISHQVAGELLALGVQPDRVYEQVYERQAEGFVRLMGMALSGFELDPGGALAWIGLTRSQIEQCRAEEADTSEIVNHLFTIQGVRVALLFKELPDGRIKVSFRSKGTLDVHRLAESLGGGGHHNASGAIVPGPLAAAISRVVPDARALFA
jgi:phosphoesterase RecJ-like protein